MIEVSYKYARALVGIASEKNKLEVIQEQLRQVKKLVEEVFELNSMILSPNIDKEKKKEIVSRVLSDTIEKELLNFILLLIDKDRQDRLPDIIDLAIDLADRERDIVKAYAYTVEKLDIEEEKLLEEKLSDVLSKKVIIENRIDESLLGGIVVKAGDVLFDGSIRGRLETLKGMMDSALQNGIGVTGSNEP